MLLQLIEIVILGATMVDIKDCLADSSSCRQPIELDHIVVANRFTIISDTGHWTAADPFDPFWSSLDNDVDPFVSIENYCHHRGDGRADSHASCPSEFSCASSKTIHFGSPVGVGSDGCSSHNETRFSIVYSDFVFDFLISPSMWLDSIKYLHLPL